MSTLATVALLFGYSTSTSGPGGTSGSSAFSAQGASTSGTGTTVDGPVVTTRWGPVQVRITTDGSTLTGVEVLQYPNGNGKDQQINSYALPVLVSETMEAKSADIDMVSGATVTSEAAVAAGRARRGRAVNAGQVAAPARYVEHVMGMPISLALRGRHTDDAAAQAAWVQTLTVLRAVDRVFSTYRTDSAVSRFGRGEIELADCPDEVAEVIALGLVAERDSGGAFALWRPGDGGVPVFDPSGVVKGWAVERAAAALRELPDTDFCLSAGGDLACRTLDPDGRGWRIGIEDPHDPRRVVAVVPVRTGAVATSGAAHRGQHVLDGRTGLPPLGVASVTVVAASLTDADIDATAAYALGADAARWLSDRPGRTGLVVWADGSTTTVPGS